MNIKNVGVLGAGAMGSGIANVAALCGFNVIMCDVEQRFVDGAIKRITEYMDKSVAKQKMTAEDRDAALARIKTTTNMEDFASSDIVIEAIIEDLEIKKEAFAKLDKICGPDAILTSNTSSMSITTLAAATSRPDKVAGMHFFNPAQIMKLVELVQGYSTSTETIDAILEFSAALGKTPIVAKKDSPGFIVNRLLFAQFTEAIRMVDEGLATVDDIDKATNLGLNHPMGLFKLMDLGGLDLAIKVLEYFYDETKDPKWNAPHNLKSLVRAGRYGKKNGKGWHTYE